MSLAVIQHRHSPIMYQPSLHRREPEARRRRPEITSSMIPKAKGSLK